MNIENTDMGQAGCLAREGNGSSEIKHAERREGNAEQSEGKNTRDKSYALPSPNPVDGAELLEELRAIMNRYVVLPAMAAEALALWVVHTYAFTRREVTTYIGIVSPEKRCGKTTLLTLLGMLAHRSLVASNISSSALFRVIERTQPTLLIDEADTFLQTRDEVRGILNAGYNRHSAYVVRAAPTRKSESEARTAGKQAEYFVPQFGAWTNENVTGSSSSTEFAQYSCWCPKVLAAIGRLPDTLEDRCIVITMQRKTTSERCERMRDLNATDLRSRCARFVSQHGEEIRKAAPSLPAGLNDRAADIWEPLFAIADIAGGKWPEWAREAAVKLSAGDDEPSLMGYFLRDIKILYMFQKADRLFSREIVELLEPFHDRPWEDLRRGREINEWWLGQQLREVGIRSRTIWKGEMSAKGYLLGDFEEAFRRYVPNAERRTRSAEQQELNPRGVQDA